ncbi:hypothetical protein UFOVP5_28 [uncultured Caudovirales phage]|uniref:Uncharacterized protein n=1 Tax=uncultured Caudovirales phage TaxID=2100421 RepID=A0A6J5KH43_9CAUD|nr:hypothetical protein UFOVP5_28 [uncultured Caudovirales phage]
MDNLQLVARPAGVYVPNPSKGLVCRTRFNRATRNQAPCETLANPIGPEADGNLLPALTTTERMRFDMADPDLAPDERAATPIYLQFTHLGTIRKWSHEPFDGGVEYVLPAPIAGGDV